MDLKLSEAEKIFIQHGVESNFRNDGRNNEDYRPILIETDVVQNANGSARVLLGQTDILVGVKAEIDVPEAARPKTGRIKFFVDCSANASPEFEGRGGESFANEISEALYSAYNNKYTEEAILKKLLLLENQLCWLLYVDVVVLECQGGNAFDCASLAVKCALYDLKIPKATVSYNENGRADVELTSKNDDYDDIWRLDVRSAPILLTSGKLGRATLLLDATREEEACLKSTLILGVLGQEPKEAKITLMKQLSGGTLDPESLTEMTERVLLIGCKLNDGLLEKLRIEELGEKPKIRGFLL
uniref:Ribosomal RNA-processing protein 42 n=1 Tax=Romanomermis culicivorax TaxID=13658 RepID=A0A915J4L9_ROMCU